MDAAVILDKLRELGISVRSEGDELVLTPGSKVPPQLIEPIKANKLQIMDVLRHSKPAVVSAAPEWHAKEVERRVFEEGVCLFWSNLFGETIAFVLNERLQDEVPPGIVCYSLPEIAMLFPDGGESTKASTLRLIHEVKKEANAKVRHVVQTNREHEDHLPNTQGSDPPSSDYPSDSCPICSSTTWWQRPDGGWVCCKCHPPVGSPKQVAAYQDSLPLTQRVELVLADGMPRTPQEIADEIGTGPKTIRAILSGYKDRFARVGSQGKEDLWGLAASRSEGQ